MVNKDWPHLSIHPKRFLNHSAFSNLFIEVYFRWPGYSYLYTLKNRFLLFLLNPCITSHFFQWLIFDPPRNLFPVQSTKSPMVFLSNFKKFIKHIVSCFKLVQPFIVLDFHKMTLFSIHGETPFLSVSSLFPEGLLITFFGFRRRRNWMVHKSGCSPLVREDLWPIPSLITFFMHCFPTKHK